jgi:hypothetical protein
LNKDDMSEDLKTKWLSTQSEFERRDEFFKLFRSCPIPENEMLANLGLFMNGQALSRLLFMNELYENILTVHGSIMEFGVRWGQNLALWSECRAMYEPYNHNRKIIGFDTFEGFPSVHENDRGFAETGDYAVISQYEEYLEKILNFHEQENPIPHLKKYQLVKGDATVELEKYLKENPETIISLAYFDFDIYEPTKVCLELIREHLTRGSIIGFDQLNRHDFPGETLAVKEVLGLSRYKLVRSRHSRVNCFAIID